jgi:hypothetical protein
MQESHRFASTDGTVGRFEKTPLLASPTGLSDDTATDPLNWRRAIEPLARRDAGRDAFLASLPFAGPDVTAGSETELHAAVVGGRATVDLPQAIERSNYYANLLRRAAAQDTPKRALDKLERYLADNPDGVWENSWVRLPLARLSPQARELLDHDLRADKRDPDAGPRQDLERFLPRAGAGEPLVRVPVSYLLRLALADAVGSQPRCPSPLVATARRLLEHFQSDNISPETSSFHVTPMPPGGALGRALARETSLRYLLTQLLVEYANRRFGLAESGQNVLVCFASHPPVRQKQLNDCISDAFYRELLINPCLAGWDEGEAKYEYMLLCHQVLSRSRLNAVAKVRDAGLIAGNLVVLPNVSDISLANNGIHVSLGSLRWQALRDDAGLRFGQAQEKWVGDLAIKIVEHFLPLFVGTYSAAPYRLDFADLHAEQVLGFLPHELDFTHLRMLWRRWKKKARIKVFGQPLSPTGYSWLDRLLSRVLRLRGDFVPDFRLLDYLVAPLSTDQCPALDGQLGNTERWKRDLMHQGTFDVRMAAYALCRLRTPEGVGYSGFEARYYSLCEGLEGDLGRGVDVQALVTALAFQWIADGEVTHADIPDDPAIESERRQIFFGAAVGIPTFFVRTDTRNRLLRRLLGGVPRTRSSHRYPGYVRVHQREYLRALVAVLRQAGAGLVEMRGARDALDDLDERVSQPQTASVAGRLTQAILQDLHARSPLHVPAAEFNGAAERHYRERLRRQHIREGCGVLLAELQRPEIDCLADVSAWPELGVEPRRLPRIVHDAACELPDGRLDEDALRRLIYLCLLAERRRAAAAEQALHVASDRNRDVAPVCGA